MCMVLCVCICTPGCSYRCEVNCVHLYASVFVNVCIALYYILCLRINVVWRYMGKEVYRVSACRYVVVWTSEVDVLLIS